jgi:molybdopterin/thiamine biosynthesis adenylyltransferase
MSNFSLESTTNSSGLTEKETQRYDRQIRVWVSIYLPMYLSVYHFYLFISIQQGAEAQSRIQNSVVLICGFRGINAEVLLYYYH